MQALSSSKQKVKQPTTKTFKVESTLKDFIELLITAPEDKLFVYLSKLQEWPFDHHDDMNQLNDLLTRFQDIYHKLIHKYTPQAIKDSFKNSNQKESAPTNNTTTTTTTSSYIPILTPSSSQSSEEFNNDKQLILMLVKCTRYIVSSCTNSNQYQSTEELLQLFSFHDFDINNEILKLLSILLIIPKYTKDHDYLMHNLLAPRLRILAAGFPENHLDLLTCCNEEIVIPESVSNFTLEFYEKSVNTSNTTNNNNNNNIQQEQQEQQQNENPGKTVMKFIDIDKRTNENLFDIVYSQLSKYSMNEEDQFHTFHRVHVAKIFGDTELRRKWVQVRLMAINCLQHADNSMPPAIFDEPDFVNELMELIRKYTVVPQDVLIASIYALSSLSSSFTNNPQSSLHSALSQGFFQSILRKCVAILTGKVPSEPPFTILFMKAIFHFLFGISTTNKSVLHTSGIFVSLLPLLQMHTTTVSSINFQLATYRIVQIMMFYKTSNIEIFGESDHLTQFLQSFEAEVNYIIENPMSGEKEVDMVVEHPMKLKRTKKPPFKSTPTKFSSQLVYDESRVSPSLFQINNQQLVAKRKVSLIFEMLHTLLPIVSSNGVPRTILNHVIDGITSILKRIFENHQLFTPQILCQSILLPTQLIQNEPTCFTTLQSSGLITIIFDYISNQDLAAETVILIITALNSFCLNQSFKQTLLESKFFERYVQFFINPKYSSAFTNRTYVAITTGLGDLVRHHTELKAPLIEATLNLVDHVLSLDLEASSTTERTNNLSVVAMFTKFLNVFFNTGENDRLFIQKNGLEKLLTLYTNPSCYGKNLNIFKTLSVNNTSQVLNAIIKNLAQQFTELDALSVDWRKSRIIRAWNEKEVANKDQIHRRIKSIGCLVSILVGLIKDHSEEIPVSVLDEWATEQGISVSQSMSCLQRSLYWEYSIGKLSSLTVSKKQHSTKSESPKLQPNLDPFASDPMQSEQSSSSTTTALSSSTTSTSTTYDVEFLFTSQIHDLEFLSHYFAECLNPANKRDALSGDIKSEVLIKTIAGNISNWLKWTPEEIDPAKKNSAIFYKYQCLVVDEINKTLFAHLINALFKLGFYDVYSQILGDLFRQYNDPQVTDELEKKNLSSLIKSFGKLLSTSVSSLTQKTQSSAIKQISEKVLPVLFEEVIRCWNMENLSKYPLKKDVLDSLLNILNKHEELPEKEKKVAKPPPPAFVPNEVSVSLLMDMGFIREHIVKGMKTLQSNNIEQVTDWMLNNPYVEEKEEETAKSAVATPQPVAPPPKEKVTIDAMAQEIKPTLVDKALNLMNDTEESSIYESVHRLLLLCIKDTKSPENKSNIVDRLMKDIELSFSDFSANSKYVIGILHLLQKLNDVQDIHNLYLDKGLLMILVGFLTDLQHKKSTLLIPETTTTTTTTTSNQEQSDGSTFSSSTNPPQSVIYLNHLLILVFDLIKQNYVKPANFDLEEEEKKEESIDPEHYLLLESCIEFLKLPPSILDYTLLKLTKELTKKHTLANQFFSDGGMLTLLNRFTAYNGPYKEMYAIANVIIRQILESRNTLLSSYHTIIKNTLTFNKTTKGISAKNYLTTLAKSVVHDPVVFLRATVDTCRLNQSSGVYLSKNAPVPPTVPEDELAFITKVVHQMLQSLLTPEPTETTTSTSSPAVNKRQPKKVSPSLIPYSINWDQPGPTSTMSIEEETATLQIVTKGHLLKTIQELNITFPIIQDIILDYQQDILAYTLRNFLTSPPDGPATFTHQSALQFVLSFCGRPRGRAQLIELIAKQLVEAKNDYNQSHTKADQARVANLVNLTSVMLNLSHHSCSSEIYRLMIENNLINIILEVMNVIDLSCSKASHMITSMLQTIGHLTRYAVNVPEKEKDEGRINIFEVPLSSFENSYRNSRDGMFTQPFVRPSDDDIHQIIGSASINLRSLSGVRLANEFDNSDDEDSSDIDIDTQDDDDEDDDEDQEMMDDDEELDDSDEELDEDEMMEMEDAFPGLLENIQHEARNLSNLLSQESIFDQLLRLNGNQLVSLANNLNNNQQDLSSIMRPLERTRERLMSNIPSNIITTHTMIQNKEQDETSYALSFEPDLIKILTKITKEEEIQKLKEKEQLKASKEKLSASGSSATANTNEDASSSTSNAKDSDEEATNQTSSSTTDAPTTPQQATQTPTQPGVTLPTQSPSVTSPSSLQVNSPQISSVSSPSSSLSSSASSIPSSVSQSPVIFTPDLDLSVWRNNLEINQIASNIASPPRLATNVNSNLLSQLEGNEEDEGEETTSSTVVNPTSTSEESEQQSSSSTSQSEPQQSSSTSQPAPTDAPVAPAAPAPAPVVQTVDLGIDPTFLAALPAELRAEVLATQLGSLHQNDSNAQITINPEFLAALPQDIQNEVLEQERLISQRRRRTIPPPADLSHAQDMDNASFLATLPPDLREEVLISQPEAFLSTLPPELHAEAVRLRERDRFDNYRTFIERNGQPSAPRALKPGAPIKQKAVLNQSGSLVEKENLIPLIKILYLDHSWNRQQLYQILQQICTFSENRIHLLTYLIQILTTPRVSTSSSSGGSRGTYSDNFNPIENPCHPVVKYKHFRSIEEANHPPLLVTRRILEILHNLITSNPNVAQWICSEQSLPLPASKKGKEKQDANESSIPLWKLCSILIDKDIFTKPTHVDKLSSIFLAILDTQKTVPVFPKQYIDNFIKSMLKNSSTPDNKNIQLLVKIGTSEENRAAVLDELTQNAKKLAGEVITNLNNIKGIFKESNISPSLVVSLLPSSIKETNLLQVLQTMSSILSPKQKEVEQPPAAAPVAAVPNDQQPPAASPAVGTQEQQQPSGEQAEQPPAPAPVQASTAEQQPAPTETTTTTTTTTTSAGSSTTTTASSSTQQENKITIGEYFKNNLEFETLWDTIKTFLKLINSADKEKEPVTTKQKLTKKKISSVPMSSLLLPLMEIYFQLNSPNPDKLNVTTVPVSPNLSGLKLSAQSIPVSMTATPPSQDYQTSRFFEFVEQNKNLINDLIRQDNSLLNRSFGILVKVPKFLDFDNKRTYFRQYFQSRKERAGTIRLKIRRNNIFEDSYMQLRMRPADEFKGKLHIQFSGEEGIDVGGLLREWYLVLSREMFNPGYALFKTSAADNVTFQPNPESYINPDHLSYFKFIGRIIGKALYDGQMLDAFFTRSFYKHMLGLPITVTDMEAIDPQYHKNLIWILNNDITNVVDLTFSTEIDIFDQTKVIELKPDGANIPVTEENKMEYVRLVASVRMTNSIKDQIASFLEGFHELIPKSLISIFNELELELLISGLPEIDIDDLRANTEYSGYTAESPQINWFWNVIQNFSNEEKALLLQFVTGTSKVPLDGFKALVGMSGLQKFQIHRIRGNAHRLPTAHTCFNQIDLPEYESTEQMEKMLKIAISENSEGFGFH